MGVIPKFEDAVTVTWKHDDFKGATELRVNFSASMLYHVKDGCSPSEYDKVKDLVVETLRKQVADSATDECHFKTVYQSLERPSRGDICECSGCGYTCARGFIADELFRFCPNCGRRVVST